MNEFVFADELTCDFYSWVIRSHDSIFTQIVNDTPGNPNVRLRKLLLEAARVFVECLLNDPNAPIASQLKSGEIEKESIRKWLFVSLLIQIDIDQIITKIILDFGIPVQH